MPNIAQINDTQVSILNFKSIPVVTSAMLADFYATDTDNIKQNYTRNKSRFVKGKHFFKIVGEELKNFASDLKSLANSTVQISSKTRNLILWTERGAARHAKMLDTDQAWDVFEQLEDCYFHRQEILAKTHKSERTALHDAHSLLVTKTKHLNSSEAWRLINQRFGTESIDQIPYDAIPVAVEYVHHLIAMYSAAEKQAYNPSKEILQILHKFVERVILTNDKLRPLIEALRDVDRQVFIRYADQLVKSNQMAREIAWSYDFKNRFGEPLLDRNCNYIALSEGQRFAVKANWFNCESA